MVFPVGTQARDSAGRGEGSWEGYWNRAGWYDADPRRVFSVSDRLRRLDMLGARQTILGASWHSSISSVAMVAFR